MAIDYTVQGTIRDDETFVSRVMQAAQAAALDISGEAIGGSTAEEWAARQALAHRVLRSTQGREFVSPVMANVGAGASTATIESEVLDSELDTAVSAVWNDVAGIAAS